MPTPAADRQRLFLMVFAVASVVLSSLSFRVVSAAVATSDKPVPTADLQALSAYLAPLPDSTTLAVSTNGTMVGESDPFGLTAPVVPPAVRGTTGAALPSKPGDRRWVVSSILFEDSRRSAILNDKWVTVGELLDDGARVSAIERKHVVITDAKGNRLVVPFQGGRRED